MLITFTQFGGVAPKLSPHKLPASFASEARNVRLAAGTLAPWKEPLPVLSGLPSLSDQATIYRFGQDLVSDTQYWFHWNSIVDVYKGAISNDQTERTYFAGEGVGFRQTNNSLALTGGSGLYPWNSLPVGVPAPLSQPGANASGGSGEPDSRVYVFTFVTALGEEGPPSPASELVNLAPGGMVTLTLPTAAPSGYAGVITAKRIYRSLTGSSSTDLFFLDEIPIAQGNYNDSTGLTGLGELIPSLTYEPPPSGVRGICALANGIMLAFTDYDVYPSEAYLPHAYPLEYSQAFNFKYVGSAAIESSCIICTTAFPYMLSGTSPASLSLTKLAVNQGCVSRRSIAAVDGGVMYASADGLVLVDTGGGVSVVTDQFLSRDEWQAITPSSVRGYAHEGRYIGFYDNGTTQAGFVWEPRAGSDKAFTWIDLFASAGYVDPLQDALYLKIGGEIKRWHAGASPMTYKWRGRPIRLTGNGLLARGKVFAKAYPVTVRQYMDGVLKMTMAVQDSNSFPLPSGRPEVVEFEFEGDEEIIQAWFASDSEELSQAALGG